MENTLNQTPSANRTHIGFFGRMNAGKSSLINAFAGQQVSIVSGTAGTTTDVVHKSMEIHGIGPCVLLDTAGLDDSGELGLLRTGAARKAADRCDVAVMVFSPEGTKVPEAEKEMSWISYFQKHGTPVVAVLNKADLFPAGASDAADAGAPADPAEAQQSALSEALGIPVLLCSAVTGQGIPELKESLIRAMANAEKKRWITGNLVKAGDSVLLVMPQDIQAPEGRLILPQVQTIRELLDRKCVVTCATTDRLDTALAAMKQPPKLIITDSQIFDLVYAKKPAESLLTSFSVLFAAYKGDIGYYVESAGAIGRLNGDSKVLIAECCTHAPLEEDIGRVKIPRLLRKRAGESLTVDLTAGADFPEDLSSYDLVIQCGACMFNRKHVMARIDKAKDAGVPMTNYGVAIAYLKGILDKVETGEA